MRLRPRIFPRIAVALAIAMLALPAPLRAQDAAAADAGAQESPESEPSSEKGIFTGVEVDKHVGKVFDVIVLRPLGLAGLAVGAVLFVPAAALSVADRDAFDECVDLFLKIPARNVFTRPIGDF